MQSYKIMKEALAKAARPGEVAGMCRAGQLEAPARHMISSLSEMKAQQAVVSHLKFRILEV